MAKKEKRKAAIASHIAAGLKSKMVAFMGYGFDETVEAWRQISEPAQKIKLYAELVKLSITIIEATQPDDTLSPQSSLEEKMRELNREETWIDTAPKVPYIPRQSYGD